MRLLEAVDAFLTATRADGRSPKTVDSYRRKLKPLTDFLGDVPVEAITADDLRKYITDLMDRRTRWREHPKHREREGGLSPFTIAGHVRALKRLFNWLEGEGVITNNPARRIKTHQPKQRTLKAVSVEDFLALLNTTQGEGVSDLRDRAIILFLADTGCRIGGLCGLRLDDLDLEEEVAFVTEKGEKTRPVPFTTVTAEALRAWLAVRPDAGEYVFVSLGNKAVGRLTPNGVRQMLRRRAKQAGITRPVNPHAFRHAFAREYLLNGGDLATLADLLGHSSVEVTRFFYARFRYKELKEKHDRHSPVARLVEKGGLRVRS